MPRPKKPVSTDPDNPVVRVRGGPYGYRWMLLSDWRAEIKEAKDKRNSRITRLTQTP